MNYFNRRWHNLSIGIRYIIFVSVVITTTIATLSILFIEQERRSADQALQNRAEILMDVITGGIQLSDTNQFAQNAPLIVSQIEKNENITFLSFFDENGNLIQTEDSTRYQDTWQEMVANQSEYSQRKDNELVVARVIYQNDTPLGGIVFGLSTAEFDERLADARRQALIFSLFAIPIAVILVSILTNQVIHRIEKLTVAVDSVARGELTEVSYHSKDELGELSTTFNRMAQALWDRDQALRELNASLEVRVQARTQELEDLARTLHEANQLLFKAKEDAEKDSLFKSEILATMSHELRTPLNAIIGFTDIMLAEIDGEINATQRSDLERIVASGEHLLSMINDTLNIAQIEAGKARLIEDTVSTARLFPLIFEPYQAQAQAKGLKFSWLIDANMPAGFVIDEKRIEHILSNLVRNAIKFTEQGFIQVSIKPLLEQNEWQIEVRDTGIGLAPENQANIFEAFRQVDNSVRRKYDGIGLGLTVVQRTVDLMQGRVELQSEPRQGSTFRVILPLKVVVPTETESSN